MYKSDKNVITTSIAREHSTIYHGDYATSLLVYLMEPLQIFYRNEQMKTPFDIVWDLKGLSKEKFYDGVFIIDHLASYAMTYLEKLIAKKEKTGDDIKVREGFLIKDGNLLNKVKEVGKKTVTLLNHIGHFVDITENPDFKNINSWEQSLCGMLGHFPTCYSHLLMLIFCTRSPFAVFTAMVTAVVMS